MLIAYMLIYRNNVSRAIPSSTITTECLTQSPRDADATNLAEE